MINSKINSGNITDHLGIVFVSINENGRCEITISEFKKLLTRAYQKGYEDASPLNSVSHTSPVFCEQDSNITKNATAILTPVDNNIAKKATSVPIPVEEWPEWEKLGHIGDKLDY